MSRETETGEYLTMWSVQTDRVLETLERDGIYYVKKNFITEKYGNTAWIFQEAYRFFTEKARFIVEKPVQAESPVWMFAHKKWALPGEGSYSIELHVPREELILFDLRRWSKVLNLSFIGTEEEEKNFQDMLRKMGIADSMDVFAKPYYPAQKAAIVKSWERLFTEQCEDSRYVQGAAWAIKKEWVKV